MAIGFKNRQLGWMLNCSILWSLHSAVCYSPDVLFCCPLSNLGVQGDLPCEAADSPIQEEANFGSLHSKEPSDDFPGLVTNLSTEQMNVILQKVVSSMLQNILSCIFVSTAYGRIANLWFPVFWKVCKKRLLLTKRFRPNSVHSHSHRAPLPMKFLFQERDGSLQRCDIPVSNQFPIFDMTKSLLESKFSCCRVQDIFWSSQSR